MLKGSAACTPSERNQEAICFVRASTVNCMFTTPTTKVFFGRRSRVFLFAGPFTPCYIYAVVLGTSEMLIAPCRFARSLFFALSPVVGGWVGYVLALADGILGLEGWIEEADTTLHL